MADKEQSNPVSSKPDTGQAAAGAESIVSSNWRWMHSEGWAVQTTVRHGATLDDVMEHLDTVFGAFEILGSQGIKPANWGNQATSTPPTADRSSDPSWCQMHKVEMKRYEKNGKVWYAHRDGDQWCNEKDRKDAGYDH